MWPTALSSALDTATRSGRLETDTGIIEWTADGQLTVTHEDQRRAVHADHLSVQLARGERPRRLARLWTILGQPAHHDLLHVEVRTSRARLLRLTTQIDDSTPLEQLPRLELDGAPVEPAPLLALLGWMRAHGVAAVFGAEIEPQPEPEPEPEPEALAQHPPLRTLLARPAVSMAVVPLLAVGLVTALEGMFVVSSVVVPAGLVVAAFVAVVHLPRWRPHIAVERHARLVVMAAWATTLSVACMLAAWRPAAPVLTGFTLGGLALGIFAAIVVRRASRGSGHAAIGAGVALVGCHALAQLCAAFILLIDAMANGNLIGLAPLFAAAIGAATAWAKPIGESRSLRTAGIWAGLCAVATTAVNLSIVLGPWLLAAIAVLPVTAVVLLAALPGIVAGAIGAWTVTTWKELDRGR